MTEILDEYGVVGKTGVFVTFGPDGPIQTNPNLPAAPPPLAAPQQVQLELPPGVRYQTWAAEAVAAGWQPPAPRVMEHLRRREYWMRAWKRLEARRDPYHNHIMDAVNAAVDITADIKADDPVPPIEQAMLDYFCDIALALQGGKDSVFALTADTLLADWLRILFDHRREVENSLLGRTDAASAALLRQVQDMRSLISPPQPGMHDWRHVR